MNLKKIIRDKLLIREYVTKDIISLKDYLNMSVQEKINYLPHEYPDFFDNFLRETDSDYERPKEFKPRLYTNEPDEVVDIFDDNYEFINWLERNNKIIFIEYGEYLLDKINTFTLSIPQEEYPSWAFYRANPKLVKNQWLIHFTNDAQDIAHYGFKYGVDDLSKLGLTKNLGDYSKKYGGYNFAYLLSDFYKYGYEGHGKYKYGDEAVIFRASGIKIWHYGDEEEQVIFFGKTANNIIPIISGETNNWGIYSNNGSLLYENDDFRKVVSWLTKNYNQYRKKLHY